MKEKIRALALFSGGLDSALAIRIVLDQNIEVIALNFVSHFFGGKNEKAEKMAETLGIQLEYIEFQKRHLEVLKEPVYGYGKNMNPCIDCHSLMFKVAGELLEKYNAKFIISGEVLGQRPMSQNFQALNKVKELSGVGELILRPLSAKLLPISKPEIEGLIQRERLLSIQGRGRNHQMELMEQYGLVEYPSPGGGCLLTDVDYSNKLKGFKHDNLLNEENSIVFYLAKYGRVFRFSEGKYIFVGRDNDGNYKLMEYKDKVNHVIRSCSVPGPLILMYGKFTDEEKKLACEIFSRYSKVKGKEKITVLLDEEIFNVEPINIEKIQELMVEYQKFNFKK